MVSPVTGPFTRTDQYLGPVVTGAGGFAPIHLYKRTTWYRQRRPFDRPLPFDMEFRSVSSYSGSEYDYRSISSSLTRDASLRAASYNKAFARYREQLSDFSQWSVNFAEMGQSVKMIGGSVGKLLKFARHLNHFNFPAAAEDLNMTWKQVKRLQLRPTAKAFGNNWLAYHFGWEPLVKDIGSAVRTICDHSPPKRKIIAKGHDHTSTAFKVSGGLAYGSHGQFRDDTYYTVNSEDHTLIQALVEAPNPNLALADSLGFTNPLSVAWELVPFSFVVDWFGNVGQVLDACVDIWDLDVVQTFVSHKQVQHKTEAIPYRGGGSSPNEFYNPLFASYVSAFADRTVGGIPSPTLRFALPSAISPTRAATSISLLLQGLRR